MVRQHRCLFSFPDFPSFSPLEQTHHERKIFPPSDLYNIVSDVASYPTFIPYCTATRVLRTSERNGATLMDAEMTVGFMSFEESYVSKVTCKPHESVQAVASSSTPLFKTLTTTWRFQPAPHALPTDDCGPTLVTLDLSFAFASPVHAAVSSAFFGQVSTMMVKAFEQRCLAVHDRGRA
ncbi:dehydrase and lipid transport-domain-containing protein [Mucidula mucida]|nr:dehydrase and lipid transport-domain-containing protein [Mucidula mucida]